MESHQAFQYRAHFCHLSFSWVGTCLGCNRSKLFPGHWKFPWSCCPTAGGVLLAWCLILPVRLSTVLSKVLGQLAGGSGLRSEIVAPGTSLPGGFQPAASLPSALTNWLTLPVVRWLVALAGPDG
jgi:hypothetical protein